ncbi:MAG: magnesium transporter CorA family protein [Oscillospiraceae bacterium]|jgi:magnesium transporter|nr:magnesium transporter CorA family protein [Oscillospiraceae bacterium]
MMRFFNAAPDGMLELNRPEPGCWVYAVAPSADELMRLHESLSIPIRFLRAAIDDEENARIDHEADCTLLMVDMPVVESEGTAFVYSTLPMGIILTDHCVVTLVTRECSVLNDFFDRRVRGFISSKRARFVIQILARITGKYIAYLKQINKTASVLESRLIGSMSSTELIQMFKLEKSLVYFTTSLRGNEAVLERILRQEHIDKIPEDMGLLEDVIIENRQAIEMCAVYRDLLSGARNAFSALTANSSRRLTRAIVLLVAAVAPCLTAELLWSLMFTPSLPGSPLGFTIITVVSIGLGGWLASYMSRKIK